MSIFSTSNEAAKTDMAPDMRTRWAFYRAQTGEDLFARQRADRDFPLSHSRGACVGIHPSPQFDARSRIGVRMNCTPRRNQIWGGKLCRGLTINGNVRIFRQFLEPALPRASVRS